MAASTYFDAVQKLYIAYYGRPADPLGQAYWAGRIDAAGGNQSAVIDAFGTSAESESLYDAISVAARVNAVYQQTLGRDADVTGLAYYVGRINDGSLTLASLALAVLAGATTGDDAAIVANKLAVANTFTAHIDTTAEILAYAGDAAAASARTFLSTVTADAASVTTATANIDATIAALPADGSTFTLTDGVDALIGTAGNDTFSATGATFTAFDNIDGGAGTDTLNIVQASGALTTSTAATVTSIEKVVLNGTAAITADVSDFSGLTSVTVNQVGTAAAVSVTTGGNATSVSVSGGSTVAVSDAATTDTLASVSLDGNTGAATITSDALTSLSIANTIQNATVSAAAGTRALALSLSDAGGITTDAEATSLTVTTEGTSTAHLHMAKIESAAISGSGDLTLVTDAVAALETLTISGSVNVTGATLSLAGSLTTITSTSTGDLDLTIAATATSVTTGAGDDVIRQTAALGATQVIATGAGDDNVRLGGALTADASINGGDGTDTLTLTTAVATAVVADTEELVFSNFEKIALSDALAGNLNLANLDDIQYLDLDAGVSGSRTISGLASNGTIEVNAAAAANTDVTTVTVTDAATGTADVLNLKLNAAASADFGVVAAANVETLNISSTTTAADPTTVTNTVDLSAGAHTTVNVSGDASLNLSGVALTSVTTFTSTSTADVTVSFAGNTHAVTYTGAAGVDTVTLGSGANVVNLGAGDDVITLNTAGLSTVTLGAGDDTVNVVATTSGNIYTTIADIAAGDSLVFVDKGAETFAATKLALADTAVFQDYLDLAAAGDGSTNGAISWFQFGSNTYVVEDRAAGSTFSNGTDVVIKLSGLVDLSDAVQAGNALTLA